ncbi:MAG: hypothetical protein SFV22_12270 [Saprospiraceae bacterium]|nr:hypothetical protein [Saprospiraceae bacterium]
MTQNNLIPNIHNYCDRWCERCVYIERCAVGLETLRRWNQPAPMSDEEIIGQTTEDFKASIDMLDELLRNAGIDPNDLANQPDPQPDPTLEKLEEEMFEKSMAYFKQTEAFFQTNEDFFEEKRQLVQDKVDMSLPVDLDHLGNMQDAVETIRQYASFIGIKASRAISGIEDMHDTEIWGDPPYQSDANGSAKACLYSIERSLGAWETLRRAWPEKTDEILDLLLMLSRLRKQMQSLFPDWEKFVRPGFDTEPLQVRRFEMN